MPGALRFTCPSGRGGAGSGRGAQRESRPLREEQTRKHILAGRPEESNKEAPEGHPPAGLVLIMMLSPCSLPSSRCFYLNSLRQVSDRDKGCFGVFVFLITSLKAISQKLHLGVASL